MWSDSLLRLWPYKYHLLTYLHLARRIGIASVRNLERVWKAKAVGNEIKVSVYVHSMQLACKTLKPGLFRKRTTDHCTFLGINGEKNTSVFKKRPHKQFRHAGRTEVEKDHVVFLYI